LLLCGVVGDIATGKRFGQLALEVLNRYNAQAIRAKTLLVVSTFIMPWHDHLTNSLDLLQEGFQTGLETGDHEYVGHCAGVYCFFLYFLGRPLQEVNQEMINYIKAQKQVNQTTAARYNSTHRQAILNMMGKQNSEDVCLLVGDSYNETEMLPLLEEANDRLGLHELFFNKLLLAYWFQNYAMAVDMANTTETYLGNAVGRPTVPLFHFYDSLARLAVYADAAETEQKTILKKVGANQKKL
jgi:predicted ATPase